MSIPKRKTSIKPDPIPTPDPTDPPTAPMNPIDQAEEMVSLFMRGAWFLKRSAAGSAADNRAALEAGIRIAELRQAKAQHVELMAVFSRIAAALEGQSGMTELGVLALYRLRYSIEGEEMTDAEFEIGKMRDQLARMDVEHDTLSREIMTLRNELRAQQEERS